MKNPGPFVRKALYALLNGVVNYNGNVISVFEGEGDENVTEQILIKDYADADKSNKSNFKSKGNQIIEIVSEQNDATLKVVDAIGELVMNLIKPNTTSTGIASDNNFQIMVMGKPSQRTMVEESGSGTKIARLILRYNFLIIEK